MDISGVLIFLLLVLHLKAACSSDPELFFSTLDGMTPAGGASVIGEDVDETDEGLALVADKL